MSDVNQRSTQTDSLLRIVLLVLLAILLFPLVMMLVMLPVMGIFGWGHMSWNGGGTWWVFLMMILPLVVLAGLLYVGYRYVGGATRQRQDTAMAELRRAYARGELSDEEFERRREKLRESE